MDFGFELEALTLEEVTNGMGAALEAAVHLSLFADRMRKYAMDPVVQRELSDSVLGMVDSLSEGMWVAASSVVIAIANNSGMINELGAAEQQVMEDRTNQVEESLMMLGVFGDVMKTIIDMGEAREAGESSEEPGV